MQDLQKKKRTAPKNSSPLQNQPSSSKARRCNPALSAKIAYRLKLIHVW
jgi:hypothetical protein